MTEFLPQVPRIYGLGDEYAIMLFWLASHETAAEAVAFVFRQASSSNSCVVLRTGALPPMGVTRDDLMRGLRAAAQGDIADSHIDEGDVPPPLSVVGSAEAVGALRSWLAATPGDGKLVRDYAEDTENAEYPWSDIWLPALLSVTRRKGGAK